MTTDERIETRIVELLEKRTEVARELDSIDSLIAELRTFLDQEHEEPPVPTRNGKPRAAKKPAAERRPRAAKPSANGDGGGSEGNVDPRARGLIGRLLFERGPMKAGDICSTLEIAQPTLNCHTRNNPNLFRKVDPENRLSPWELTEEGRQRYGTPGAH